MNYEIDPQYKIVNRIIKTDGVDDIEANEINYVNYEVIDHEPQAEKKRKP